jgi:hypothetical protein
MKRLFGRNWWRAGWRRQYTDYSCRRGRLSGHGAAMRNLRPEKSEVGTPARGAEPRVLSGVNLKITGGSEYGSNPPANGTLAGA